MISGKYPAHVEGVYRQAKINPTGMSVTNINKLTGNLEKQERIEKNHTNVTNVTNVTFQ